MLRGYRFTVIAIGLAVLCGSALAQQQEKPVLKREPITTTQQDNGERGGGDDSSQKQPETEKLAPALQQIESAIRETIAPKDQAQDERHEAREKADLQAQVDMAFWAEMMFWATAVTAGITLVGVALLVRTLHHTRRAADYAKDMVDEARATTKAAFEANANTVKAIEQEQTNARRQLRAYLVVDRLTQIIGQDGTPSVKVTIKNSGQTPAYNTVIATALVIAPLPIRTMVSPARGGQAPKTILGAGGKFSEMATLDKAYGPEQQTEVLAKRSAMVVSGNVSYVDGFNASRWMNFNFSITGSFHVPNGETFTPCAIGNEASEPEK